MHGRSIGLFPRADCARCLQATWVECGACGRWYCGPCSRAAHGATRCAACHPPEEADG